jgi:hypothetical protein
MRAYAASLCFLCVAGAHAFYLPTQVRGGEDDGGDFGQYGAWNRERRAYAAATGTHLRLWDGREVNWATGQVAALIETSLAVRFSPRGIHFYARDDGNEHVWPSDPGRQCLRGPGALCTLVDDEDGGNNNNNRVFPHDAPPRFGFDPGRGRGCGLDGGGGRVLVADPMVYDLSPCDLADLDILWADGRLHVEPGIRLPLWAYAASGLAVFFLVVSLGQNLGSILGDPAAVTHPLFTEALCLVQGAVLLALNDPWRVWVSTHDQAMLLATIAYMALYLGRHGFALCMQQHVHTLNVITATLVLVTARLYCSFETPYATVFLLLLLARMAHKLFAARMSGLERLTVAADAAYLALYYRLAYRPSFFDPQAAPVYLSALAAACLAVGALTHAVEVRAEALRQPEGVGAGGGATVLGNECHPIAFRADGRDPGHNLCLQFLDR